MGVVQLRPPKMGGGGRRHVDRIYRIKSFGGWFLSKPGLPYLHPVINIPVRIKPKNGAGRKTSPVLRCREYYFKYLWLGFTGNDIVRSSEQTQTHKFFSDKKAFEQPFTERLFERPLLKRRHGFAGQIGASFEARPIADAHNGLNRRGI